MSGQKTPSGRSGQKRQWTLVDEVDGDLFRLFFLALSTKVHIVHQVH